MLNNNLSNENPSLSEVEDSVTNFFKSEGGSRYIVSYNENNGDSYSATTIETTDESSEESVDETSQEFDWDAPFQACLKSDENFQKYHNIVRYIGNCLVLFNFH